MALVLNIANGDVVDIADRWIALLSIENREAATLIIDNGDKVSVSSEFETEILPAVWVQLGLRAGPRRLKLLVEAPKDLVVTRRQ